MAGISVCMIVKNEEEILARRLTCAISSADEVIVMDTGGADKTKEIAAGLTDKLYDFAWRGDFSKARNYSFSKATQDFTMQLGADDVILQEDQEQLVELKQRLQSEVSIMMMGCHTTLDDKGNPTFSCYWERSVNRRMQHRWTGAIHEVIPLTGMVQYKDTAITYQELYVDDPDYSLRIFEKLLVQGKQLDTREQLYYARELYCHTRYHDVLQVSEAFLDGKQGQVGNNVDVCEMVGYCHSALQQKDEELQAYLQSFRYDAPRVELCYGTGKYLFDEERWGEAVFWYRAVLHRTRDGRSDASVHVDYYGYLSAVQLYVCYRQLHDRQASMHCNNIAGKYKPDSIAAQQNREFFGDASQ